MDFLNTGKCLMWIGLGTLLFGLILFIAGKMGLHAGKLPGDINLSREKFSFYAPIATSIVVSLILTVILNLILWFVRK